MMDAKEAQGFLNKAETPALRKYLELFIDLDDDDSFPEIECDLCSKTFSSVKAYEQHLNGKKHHQMLSKMKVKKNGPSDDEENENTDPVSTNELKCDVCEKTCSGYKSYVAHMRGSIHAKNVKQQKLKESLKDKPEVLAENGDEVESEDDGLLQKPFARCSVCEKVLYDPTSYQNHMNGSIHKKRMLLQRTLNSLKNDLQDDPQIEDEEFFTKCGVCNKQFSGPVPFKIHLKSTVHENQIKRVQTKEKLKDFFLQDPTMGKMVCKECKKIFPDPFAFKLHLDNNSHEKQNVKDKVLEFVASNPEIAVEIISSEDDNEEKDSYNNGCYYLVCKLCHVSFSGIESAKEHVLSKKHIKAKDEKKKMKLLKIRMSEKKDVKDTVNGENDNSKNATAVTKSATEMDNYDAVSNDFEII